MYQYKREPLSNDEVNKLLNACETPQEKLIIYTLLDTGIRVSELAGLTKQNIQWQEKRIVIYGKGGPYGSKSKRRLIPMTERVHAVLSAYFTLNGGIKNRLWQKPVDAFSCAGQGFNTPLPCISPTTNFV